jgi:hypothetical protein
LVTLMMSTGSDLVVRVTSPAGTLIGTYDGRDRAIEPFSFTADEGGTYRITITPVAPRVRRAAYTITVEPPRPKWPADDRLVEAEALTTEAKQLQTRGSVRQSWRRSLVSAMRCTQRGSMRRRMPCTARRFR